MNVSFALSGLELFFAFTQGVARRLALPWAIICQPYRLSICVNSGNSRQNLGGFRRNQFRLFKRRASDILPFPKI
jgi:hypothetical protein